MRMLQVCNVPTVVGGTGACAWTITRALPAFQHGVYFNSGVPIDETSAAFGQEVAIMLNNTSIDKAIDDFEPDIVMFHNTHPSRMPQMIDPRIVTFYYQHSHNSGARGARDRCDLMFACSKFLAKQAGIDERFVLHQPCPIPPKHSDREPRKIGRICTPTVRKWNLEEITPVYGHFRERFPDLLYDFVGCPESFQRSLYELLGFDKVRFIPASWAARSHLYEWQANVYSSLLSESYGRTVCEAQRAGCVPIVTRLGGFIEQINHGVDGFLCTTPEDFGDALEKVLSGEIDRSVVKSSGDRRGSFKTWAEDFLISLECALKSKSEMARP